MDKLIYNNKNLAQFAMEVKTQESPNREITLTIKLTEAETNKYKEKAAQKLAKQIKVKGFRAGKAPLDVVEKHIGKPVFIQEVLDIALPQTYFDAIKQEKVEPITKPQIEVKSVEPLEFDAKVALMPEVKLNNITKIKIKREKQKIEKDELDGTIYELRKYQATYKDIDRDAKIGDRAEIDFEGFEEDDTTLDNTASKNYPIVIGDNAFVPGFEENLIGMKTGDKKEFVITFPKDYHRKDFQNKKVKFKVSLNRLEEMQLPEVNKEFSKKIIGKELDEKEFIEAIKTDILRQKESKEDQRQQAKLFEEIAKQADINMSSLIVDEELDYMLHQQKHELEQRGIKWEEFLKSMDEKKRDIREERKDEAEQRVKVRLALRDIIKEKDLAVKDEEVLAKLKEFNQSKADLTPNSGAFKQVKDQLLLEKVFNEFLEKSVA